MISVNNTVYLKWADLMLSVLTTIERGRERERKGKRREGKEGGRKEGKEGRKEGRKERVKEGKVGFTDKG